MDPNCVCSECGNPQLTGVFESELRPFGKDGKPICFVCAFATPEAVDRTLSHFDEFFKEASGEFAADKKIVRLLNDIFAVDDGLGVIEDKIARTSVAQVVFAPPRSLQ